MKQLNNPHTCPPKASCLQCEREAGRRQYQNNKPTRLEQHRKWLSKNPNYFQLNRWSRLYKLTCDDYYAILESQNFCCAICHRDTFNLHIDHDHKCCPSYSTCCGKCIRGLLCNMCNQAAGMLQDDPIIARELAHYLELF